MLKAECAVFLATYNGSRYLREQIDSILNQDSVDVHIYVIDDSSSDSTVEILKSFLYTSKITYRINTQNLGIRKVYYQFRDIHVKQKYIAFADQDDLWEHDKLATLIAKFDSNQPTLVFSARQAFSSQQKYLNHKDIFKNCLTWQNAIVQNVIPLNCIVLNEPGLKLVWKYINEENYYFDSWMYLLFSVFGTIHYEDSNLVNYRIHETNLVGLRSKKGIPSRIDSIFKTFSQAVDLVNMVSASEGNLNPRFVNMKKVVVSVLKKKNFQKMIAITRLGVRRQTFLETLAVRFILFFYSDKRPMM